MRQPRTILIVALAAASAWTAACGGENRPRPAISPSRIELDRARLAIRTGPVGEGQWKREATYALVEARNRTDRDVMVTLAGDLRDQTGAPTWPLRRESMRVPAGGTRLFALVDEEQQVRASARGARVDVVGAVAVEYAPPFQITDGNVVMDQDRAVAAGYVVNTAERDGSAVVIGAFFDQAGAPLQRTSTVFALSPGGRRGLRLVGPPGSRSAYLFIGEVSY
jgi:hypothetical protein